MKLTNGWIDVRDALPPLDDGSLGDFTVQCLCLVESPDFNTLWRDIYAGYQEVYTDDDGREIRTWYTYRDGDCERVGFQHFQHYPCGKGRTHRTGAKVVAWQPMPDFPDTMPHREYREGVREPGTEED